MRAWNFSAAPAKKAPRATRSHADNVTARPATHPTACPAPLMTWPWAARRTIVDVCQIATTDPVGLSFITRPGAGRGRPAVSVRPLGQIDRSPAGVTASTA
ncbi:hypothetical protein GCM10022223_18450 [Kineosporia mesophila]|uniref:Uncharacterized protein n=1 Tax=Kineosporia mesophila TaxID=566012 RepID=A0ABP6ZB29_9ACTN